MKRRANGCAILALLTIVGVGIAGFTQGEESATDKLQRIQAASNDLVAFSATIEMTRHEARSDSTIVFDFSFAPSERMRICYTAPASLNGQTMILNGNRFYTYIPSMNRRVWQDVGKDDDSRNQGEEMGFLFEFVNQSTEPFFAAYAAQIRDGAASNPIVPGDLTTDAVFIEFVSESERQCVWIDTEDFVPVAVDLYADGELTMEVRVLDYELNGELPEDWFAIPEE